MEAVWPVELAHTLGGAVMAGVAGQPTTLTATLLELFAVLTSGVVVLTAAVLVRVVPLAGAVTPIVRAGAVDAAASGPAFSEQVMVVVPLQVQLASVPLLVSVTPGGSVSTTVTLCVAPAPVLFTVRV